MEGMGREERGRRVGGEGSAGILTLRGVTGEERMVVGKSSAVGREKSGGKVMGSKLFALRRSFRRVG